METELHISTGILEQYILGNCSEFEAAQVEKLLENNPAVQQEFLEIQHALEAVAFENAIQPKSTLKSQIWNEIQIESTPIYSLDVPTEKKGRNISWLNYAASFTLIFSVSSLAIYFYSELNSSEKLIAKNLQKMEDLNMQIIKTKDSLTEIQSNLNLIAEPSTIKIALAGVPTSKDSHAVVFWNQSKKQVILTGIDLPKSPENKQYQLWALVDGVPVDAGVFDSKSSNDLISMKSIEKGQAFAITLEPKGGSPTPHLESLCVIGNV